MGLNSNDIAFTVDKNKVKQNKFLPGSHIPVYDIDKLNKVKASFIFIFPWNLKVEIANQIRKKIDYNVKFITAVPKLEIFD